MKKDEWKVILFFIVLGILAIGSLVALFFVLRELRNFG